MAASPMIERRLPWCTVFGNHDDECGMTRPEDVLGCTEAGADFLGFAHTLPQVNLYTHGTLVTAMHGHLAFWGAYAMIVLGIISYAMPLMTGRKCYQAPSATLAFWTSNVGMIAMTLAFAVAGVTQVYLERRIGMDFVTVQKEIEVHFYGLILAACLFTSGIAMFVWNFVSYGLPVATAGTPDLVVEVEEVHVRMVTS